MNYQLPSHIRMCHTLRGIVFLDLKRNRYTGLPPSAFASLHGLLGPCDSTLSESHVRNADALPLVAQLLDAGLIEARTPGEPTVKPTTVPVGTVSFLQLSHHDARNTTHPLRFARAYLWARRALKRRLWDVLGDLNQHRCRCENALTADQVACIAGGFHRLRPYAFTARDQCLLHALALLHYLAACGVPATWLIGVQTHPWGAHSWVQWQDVVLDAAPEQTLPFTPILIA